jgi:replicative DNA helicase
VPPTSARVTGPRRFASDSCDCTVNSGNHLENDKNTSATCDLDSEAGVIGSAILSPGVVDSVSGLLPEHFSSSNYREVWRSILRLHQIGSAIDHVTIAADLKLRKKFESVGGAKFLSSLTDAVATSENAAQYAKAIRGKSSVRALVALSTEIAAEGYSGVGDVAEYLTSASHRVSQIAAGCDLEEPVQIAHGMGDVVNQALSVTPPRDLLRTGYSAIDAVNGGVFRGLLHLVAGRPGMGKSAFVLNLALKMSTEIPGGREPLKGIYFSLEDRRAFVQRRLIARHAGVPTKELCRGKISGESCPRVVDSLREYASLPLWIFDKPRSVETIGQITRRHIAIHGQLDYVIVDHTGFAVDRDMKEYDAISAASGKMAALAADLDVAVIACHQLNREVESRTDKRPMLRDLRGSGQLEQDARVVWFLYRPSEYDQTADQHELELIAAKVSHGQTGITKMFVDLARMTVRDVDDRPMDEPMTSGFKPVFDRARQVADEEY